MADYPWSYWSERHHMCKAGRPGEICQHDGNPGTIIVAFAPESPLEISWAALTETSANPQTKLDWDSTNSGYVVSEMETGSVWYQEGLRQGDIITEFEGGVTDELPPYLVGGGSGQIIRGVNALDIQLSPISVPS